MSEIDDNHKEKVSVQQRRPMQSEAAIKMAKKDDARSNSYGSLNGSARLII